MRDEIDQKIQQDLQAQASELDHLMGNSLVDYLKIGFAQDFSWLVKLGYVIAILLSLLLFYCGYQFFTAPPERELFWGVCLILSFNAQVATKLWIFMQTNRNMLSRELRILELRRQSQ